MWINLIQKIILFCFFIKSFFAKPIKKSNHKDKLKGKNVFSAEDSTDIINRIKTDTTAFNNIYYKSDLNQRILIIGSYHLTKKFYNQHRHKTIRQYGYLGYVFEKLLVDCIGANYGPKWLEMKKPLSSFFTTKSVENKFPLLIEEVNKWMGDNFVNGTQLSCSNEHSLVYPRGTFTKKLDCLNFDELTISILSRIIYGNINYNIRRELLSMAREHEKIMGIMSSDPVLRVPLLYKFVSTQNKKRVDAFWDRWYKFNFHMESRVDKDSLFYYMKQSPVYADEKKFLQTLYEIMLFNADIMTDAFSNLIRNLALHIDTQNKIYDECKSINPSDRFELDKLSYLKLTINESARLYPGIVYTFAETTTEELELDDFIIPANTLVSLDTQMINRDPAIWTDPNLFNPDRFLNHEEKGLFFKYHRFGIDQRKCLGNIFADYILKLVVVTLVKKYDFSIVGSTENKSNRITIGNLSNYNLTSSIEFKARA